MTTAPARTVHTAATAGRPRAPLSAVALPSAVAVVSLLATAAMWTGFPLVPPLAWATALIAVAVGCAAVARRAHMTQRGTTSHLAVEPFAMALMVVLDVFHTHGDPAAALSHSGHLDWFGVSLHLAVAALAVVCPVLAVRHARRVGAARGTLPVVAAVAMAVMATGMLLPH